MYNQRPFNKAAYVFGIASLQSGNEAVMAAVMAGGMVPPLAIALATTFYKNRFTPQERDSGKVNYIMGAPMAHEGMTFNGSAAANGIAPSVINDAPIM